MNWNTENNINEALNVVARFLKEHGGDSEDMNAAERLTLAIAIVGADATLQTAESLVELKNVIMDATNG